MKKRPDGLRCVKGTGGGRDKTSEDVCKKEAEVTLGSVRVDETTLIQKMCGGIRNQGPLKQPPLQQFNNRDQCCQALQTLAQKTTAYHINSKRKDWGFGAIGEEIKSKKTNYQTRKKPRLKSKSESSSETVVKGKCLDVVGGRHFR